jgi:hypothetical protein
MKVTSPVWLVASLLVGVVNMSGTVSADDRRFDTRDERYDTINDRSSNWREQLERFANTRDDRDLEGIWYRDGDRRRRTEIVSTRGGGLEAVNERGQTSRLEFDRGGDVYAPDWGRGLRGEVRRDRIEWENGITWMREPHTRSASRR